MTCPVRHDHRTGMWLVEDPSLVRAVLLNADAFSPDNALTAHTPLSLPALRTLASAGFALPPTLANNATASHRAIRRVVARFFGPARVRAAMPLTRRLATTRLAEALDVLAAGEHVDLAEMVARDVPALVLLDLLGVADIDVAALKRWSADSLELFWGRPTSGEQERLATTAAEFYTWLRYRTCEARRSPADDLFGRLAAIDLTDEEICAAAYFVLIAGQETTTQLISAAFHQLISDSVRWRSIGRSPGLAGPAIETVLAENSPVCTWRRTATRDVTLGQERIAAGSPLLLALTGVGGSSSLAFGVGAHRCLGAALARMEARVAVEEASGLLPNLRLSERHPPMIELLSFRAPSRVLVSRPGSIRSPGSRAGLTQAQ